RKRIAASPSATAPAMAISRSVSSNSTRSRRPSAEPSTTRTLTLSCASPVATEESLRSEKLSHGFDQGVLVETARGEVGVGAHVDATLTVFPGPARRDQDDRQSGQLPVGPYPGSQLESIQTRHLDVGHKEVERPRAQTNVCVTAVDRRLHGVACRLEDGS